jgi:hypothetical protein
VNVPVALSSARVGVAVSVAAGRLAANGASVEGVRVAPSASHGIGVFATRDFPPDEPMFVVPVEACITHASAMQSPVRPLLSACPFGVSSCEPATAEIAILLHLHYEAFVRGDDSFW